MLRIRYFAVAAVAVALWAAPLRAEDKLTASLKKGTPELKSIGALAFGPEGILFVGDAIGGAVFAIDTGDREPCKETDPLKVEGLDGKFASLLGIEAKQLQVNGMAVNPISTKVYFSVSRGKGPEAKPVLLRVDRKGKAEEVSLRDVPFAKAMLTDVPAPDAKGGFGGRQPLRPMAITQLAYIKGNVYVAGLSTEEWSSAFRSIPFPFKDAEKGASVGIFHGSHGRFETNAPIRTFLPIDINGEANLLAAYTCTPLVKIPLKDLKPGAKIKGVTVAELGNRNTPLDMVLYTKGGKEYLLIANTSRGVMKVSTEGIDKAAGITKRVPDKAGLSYEEIKGLGKVEHLAKLNKDNALLLVRADDGSLDLKTIALP